MTTHTRTPSTTRIFWREWFGSILILLIVVGGFVAAQQIWQAAPAVGGEILARYAPLRDGEATLQVETGAADTPTRWMTTNTIVLPPIDIGLLLRLEEQRALQHFYHTENDLSLLIERASFDQLYLQRDHELGANGILTDTAALVVRNGQGDFLVSQYLAASDTVLAFDPAPLLLPADLAPGKVWASQGKMNGFEYGYKAEARAATGDCIDITTNFTLTTSDKTLTDIETIEQYCPDRGHVATSTTDHEARTTSYSRRIDGQPVDAQLLPPAKTVQPIAAPTGEPATWVSVLFGDMNGSARNAEATFTPVWIPTEPPLLLAGNTEGDLVAFDGANPAGVIRWRFHVGGPIYGVPTYDPASGLVVFGASDKRVYAVDTYGLFRWSVVTDDVVSARPLVTSDMVIVAGEDQRIRGLDLRSGTERWSYAVGSSVASSPALAANLAIFGTDDGRVIALDTQSGVLRWRNNLDNTAVEASVVVHDGVAYIAARDGTIAALDTTSGDPHDGWAMRPIDTLRNAPAVGNGVLAIVDTFYTLHVFDAATGIERWRTSEAGANLVGTPMILGDQLYVATDTGGVRRFELDGGELSGWTPRRIETNRFAYSLGLGGSALWLAGPTGQIFRLGPSDGVARLTPTVLIQRGEPPLVEQNAVATSVALYGDRRVLVDWIANTVWLVDADGAAQLVAQVDSDVKLFAVDPVVTGDTLLLESDGLQAVNLRNGTVVWQAKGGKLYAAPSVGEGLVAWVESGKTGSVVVTVADVATGTTVWKKTVATAGVGGALIRDGHVYLSSPPAAFDLQTGKQLWKRSETGVGSAAISDDGTHIYTATQDERTGGAFLSARVAESGAELWRVALPAAASFSDNLQIAGDRIVVALDGGGLAAFAQRDGTQLWHTIPTIDRWGAITVAAGAVWFVGGDGGVYGYRTSDGELAALYTQRAGVMRTLGTFSFLRPTAIGDRLAVGLNHIYVELPLDIIYK